MINLNKKRKFEGISSSTLKMIHALPVNCTCPICTETKRRIKNELGEKKFIETMDIMGKNHYHI